jgi:Meckel syndrome type 1 protein
MAVLRHLWSLQGAAQEFQFEFPAEVPESLRAVVRRACRMNPEERYASAEEMREALAGTRERRGEPAAPETREPRRFGVAAVVALGALVLALGFWIGLGSYGERSSARSARSAAEATHAQAGALVGGLSSRKGPGAAEAIEDARRRIEYAGEEQREAELALQAMNYGDAQERFTRASDGYTRACQSLLDRWLRAAAAQKVDGARKAVAAAPASEAFTERVQKLGEPSEEPGCGAAEAERERLFAAESLFSDAIKVIANTPGGAAKVQALETAPPPAEVAVVPTAPATPEPEVTPPEPVTPEPVVTAAAETPEPVTAPPVADEPPVAEPAPTPTRASAPPFATTPAAAASPTLAPAPPVAPAKPAETAKPSETAKLPPVAAQPATAKPAPAPAPTPAPSRPAVRDSRSQKQAIEGVLRSWNQALNARNWGALPGLQKLRPGQLARYQSTFAKKNVRQSMNIDFVAGFDTGHIDVQVSVVREEKGFFSWKVVARETYKGIAFQEGSNWKIELFQ